MANDEVIILPTGPAGPPGKSAVLLVTPNVSIALAPYVTPVAPTLAAHPAPVFTGTIMPPQGPPIYANSLAQIVAQTAPSGLILITIFDGNGGPFDPRQVLQLRGTGLAGPSAQADFAASLPDNATQQQVAQAIVDAITLHSGTVTPEGPWNVTATLGSGGTNYWAALAGHGNAPISDNFAIGPISYTGFSGSGTARGYKLVFEDALGRLTNASTEATAGGPTSLDGSNYMTLTWTDPAGAAKAHIFRSTGGALDTLGYIGFVNAGVQTFNDTGQLGDSSSAPATNFTGVGLPVSIKSLAKFSLYVGDFVGSWHAEISGDQGGHWYNLVVGSDISGAGFLNVEALGDLIRIILTAQTGPLPQAYYKGLKVG